MDFFSNTLNRFKMLSFVTIRWAMAPGPPAGGRVIALSGLGVPPPKNPGDATGFRLNINIFLKIF